MYQNTRMWDRLRVCAVGRSWPPEFYHWIQDPTVRQCMETIAQETEEDYQALIECLKSLDVEVIRPIINNTSVTDVDLIQRITQSRPPMCPGDDLVMLGDTLVKSFSNNGQSQDHYNNIINHVKQQGNRVVDADIQSICGADVYQLGNCTLFTLFESERHQAVDMQKFIQHTANCDNVHRIHQFGHIDGWFLPVTPGLIVTTSDLTRPELTSLFFETYFTNWEVISLPPTLTNTRLFQTWCQQHSGLWWVPGQEHNKKFINFVDNYFSNWLGNVQETVFDINMIVVDQHNVIVSHYNQEVFDAFARHNVTPHIVQMRHANFWDGGVHCVITELHREN
jgi:hypothetical protein